MIACTIASHDTAKLDLAWWQRLPLIGPATVFDADEHGPAERYEQRDCPKCGSTLCMRFEVQP